MTSEEDLISHEEGEEEESEAFEEEEVEDIYGLTKEENEWMCRAFTLLDVDGDGVIEHSDLEKLLVTWGRMPFGEDLEEILSCAQGTGCEGMIGMTFQSFRQYIAKQLADTRNEDELREAFEIFDSTPPTGRLNVKELRHYLKYEGRKLTDDEIDHFFKEEDYWMLEEKNMFEYEDLINKLLGRPCQTQFLNF